MHKLLKAAGYLAAGVAALIVIAAAAVYGASEMRYRKHYAVDTQAIVVPTDSASLARGAHLAQSFGGCVECHGENLAGKMVFDDPAVGRVYGANLTRGRGGIGAVLTDADIVRALRHGVGRNGRALKVMPSSDFANLTEADLASIVAWVRSRPPVDTTQPLVEVGPVGRALFIAGKLPMLHAERIDHTQSTAMTVTPAVSAEYGKYVAAVGCQGCHGTSFAGGPIPGGAPDWPPAANLTAPGSVKTWSEAAFAHFLRTGVRPNGIPANPVMPIRLTKNLTDDEIQALWLYLRTVPTMPTGGLQTASR